MHRNSLFRLDPTIALIEGEGGADGGTPPENDGAGGDGGQGGSVEGKADDDGGSGDDGSTRKSGDGGSGDADSSGNSKTGDDAGKDDEKFDRKYVEQLRGENARARRKFEEEREALLKGFRKLLGEDVDAEETDPSKLLGTTVQERDTARTEAASLTRENAVLRATGALGVDADRLLDSRGFERALAELDPAAESFVADVKALIKKAAEKDPALKVKSAPAPPSGGERMGGEAGADGSGAATAKGDVEKARDAIRKRRENVD